MVRHCTNMCFLYLDIKSEPLGAEVLSHPGAFIVKEQQQQGGLLVFVKLKPKQFLTGQSHGGGGRLQLPYTDRQTLE